MSDVRCRRPTMGTADNRRNRKAFAAFKGVETPRPGGNFLASAVGQKILSDAGKPSEIHALAAMAKRPRSKGQGPEPSCQSLSSAIPLPSSGCSPPCRVRSCWASARSCTPSYREAAIVKYLPLFFDLGGRRVVVVGTG